jgi:hypothetical protein
MADKPSWEKLRSIGLVEREVEVDEKVQTERASYLSSLPAEAERFAAAVGHRERRVLSVGRANE